ncbi:MAG: hypothetical protein WCY02_04360 [Parvibaculum sp.]
MRLILGLIVIAIVAVIAFPVIWYGEVDPCRMLAKEMAHEAYGPLAELVGNDPDDVPSSMESSMRLVTSQMGGRECVDALRDRWTSGEKR